ncbi:MAG: hypothetical protein ABSG08_18820 [Terriglobales bacterium]|jgi:hypothetical protein
MKTSTLLYYPDFHPNASWLRRILLLADDVTRIVPLDVELHDPQGLLALQDSVPGCLRTISPEKADIAIENDHLPRLVKAFAFLARSRSKASKETVTIVIAPDGSSSIVGHVFLHSSKVSPVIHDELRRNGLILSGLERISGQKGFIVVDKAASDLILSGIAGNISRRTGFDAITDKPVPFALNALNNLGVGLTPVSGGAEGAVLASLTSILIPAEVATLKATEYRSLRESYAPIRIAFKELTADLARINRLNRIQDPRHLNDEVEATARDFFKEYQAFRKSRYARGFKAWAPLYVGGLLSIVGAVVAQPYVVEIAGLSLGINIIQRIVDSSADHGRERVFNMLAGLRKDIIHRSGINEII